MYLIISINQTNFELQATNLDLADTKPKQHEALQSIDLFLSDRTFLAGNFKTESDLFLYETLHPW